MNAASASGSATVADRPVTCSPGDSERSRAMPSMVWSPRFDSASAWISSTTTRFRPRNIFGASGYEVISASDSGVVSRICGGSTLWRARFAAGVSPVRSSMRIGSPISATGAARLRAISVVSAFRGDR